LDGGIGNDRLIDVASIPFGFTGIIGRDTLRGGEGDDRLEFYSPDTGDFAYGDGGTDTVFLDFRTATATQRVTFRLSPNTAVKLGDANTVGLLSIERVEFLGGKGDDFVVGGELNDTLIGGLGSYGFGPDGNDVLHGLGGDDSIDGGTGIQRIDGGDGVDTASFDLSGAGVALRILSGAVINLGAWGSVRNVENLSQVKTSTGNDVFDIDQANRISITSADGADRITVGDGGGSVYSGQGNDFVRMGADSDYVNPGYGADTVYLGAGDDSSDNYEGGSSRSSTEPDRVYGEAGNDRIYTSAGADALDGGADNDTLYGGGGADTVFGGAGDDRIEGEGGGDRVDGGAGNDVINADYDYWTDTTPAAADTLIGGEGNDTITGGIGLDVMSGGLGDDKLTAYASSGGVLDTQVDRISGGAGIDTLGFEGFSYLSPPP
jgi:Ca2+-binding RTX toxin-like protein